VPIGEIGRHLQFTSADDWLEETKFLKAVYEGGKEALAELLSQGNIPSRTMKLKYTYLLLAPFDVPGIEDSPRAQLWMCCAGRASQNALTGSSYFLDNGDLCNALALAGDYSNKSVNIVKKVLAETEMIILKYLSVPIMTAASILYEDETIEAEDAKALWRCVMPVVQPLSAAEKSA